MNATDWEKLDTALVSLNELLDNIEWHQPLGKTHTAQLRACAVRIRDLIDDESHPRMDDLALISVLDALLDWLVEPQDETRINRFRRAYEIYAELYHLADEGL
jgi:hypothetical protein